MNELLIKINRIFLGNDTNKISKYVLTVINYLKKYFLIYIFHFLLNQMETLFLLFTVKSHTIFVKPLPHAPSMLLLETEVRKIHKVPRLTQFIRGQTHTLQEFSGI